MSGVRFFMFLVALPALAAIAHDGYLFYINQPQDFMLSATGFLWTKYHPESFRWVKDAVDPETWSQINLLLEQKALFVTIAFAAFFYVIIAVLQLLRIGPFGGSKKSKEFSGSDNRVRHKR